MGQRGTVPTPTHILEFNGSRRAKKRGGEPIPTAGTPKCPPSLRKKYARIWRSVLGMFKHTGCTPVLPDAAQLERYCRYLIRWRECEDKIDELTSSGILATIHNDESRRILRHLLAESHRCDATLKRSESQFCLTPAARASAGIALNLEKSEPQGIEAFARKRG